MSDLPEPRGSGTPYCAVCGAVKPKNRHSAARTLARATCGGKCGLEYRTMHVPAREKPKRSKSDAELVETIAAWWREHCGTEYRPNVIHNAHAGRHDARSSLRGSMPVRARP